MSQTVAMGHTSLIILSSIVIASLIFLFGPREPFLQEITFDAEKIGDDVDLYLEATEGAFSDIRPGLEKQVIWANPERKEKTDIAIVYIHGFTASLGEVRPVPDKVARAHGANLFFTRLRGHGRTFEAMVEPRLDDWIDDVAEAISIGERLGDKVILISTSMGGSLVSWIGANKAGWRDKVAGYILISPNFEIADPGGFLLTWPWARYFVPALVGNSRGEKPNDRVIEHIWTSPHPVEALFPMAKITVEANNARLENIKTPALFIYSPNDQVVVSSAIESAIERWGGLTQRHVIDKSGHENNHVIMGDALSPDTSEKAISKINSWINHNF